MASALYPAEVIYRKLCSLAPAGELFYVRHEKTGAVVKRRYSFLQNRNGDEANNIRFSAVCKLLVNRLTISVYCNSNGAPATRPQKFQELPMKAFNEMTVRELRTFCVENGVKKYSKYVNNRHKFVAFLEARQDGLAAQAGAVAVKESLEAWAENTGTKLEDAPELEDFTLNPGPSIHVWKEEPEVVPPADEPEVATVEPEPSVHAEEPEPEAVPQAAEPMTWQLRAVYLSFIALGVLCEGLTIGAIAAWKAGRWFTDVCLRPAFNYSVEWASEMAIPVPV